MKEPKNVETKLIRAVWNKSEKKWYFVIIDVVNVFHETLDPFDYLKKAKRRDLNLAKKWNEIITQKVLETSSGKQKINCADLKSMLRIILCLPSQKADIYKSFMVDLCFQNLNEAASSITKSEVVNKQSSNKPESSKTDKLLRPDPMNLLFPTKIRSIFGEMEIVEFPDIVKIVVAKKRGRPRKKIDFDSEDLNLSKKSGAYQNGFVTRRVRKKKNDDKDIFESLSSYKQTDTPKRKLGTHVITKKGLARISRKSRKK